MGTVGGDCRTFGEKSSAESTSADGTIAFQDYFALSHLVDEAHYVADLSLADGVFDALQSRLARPEFVLQDFADVLAALGPLGVLDFDFELIRFDAVLDLVAGAEEAVVEDAGGRVHDLLLGVWVGSESGIG